MADVARLIVAVGAQTRDLEAAFARSTRKVQAFADGVGAVGSRLTASVTAPALAAAAAIGVATARMDSLKRGLEAVTGSSDAANRQLARLTEIAKAPGIGFAEAIQGSVRLQSVGFSARLAERSLKAFANAVALTGGGRAELARVTTQLGQLASKGKVLTQDLRPIIEAAPAVGRALREAFGTVNAEDIEKLGLSSEQFLDRLLSQLEKLPQVSGGLGNAFENLKDTIFRAFATVGEDQAGALTSTINALSARVEAAAKAFASLSPFQQKVVLGFAAAATAAGPLLIALSALANAYRTLIAINIASSTVAATRAFVAQVAAVRSLSAAMGVAGVAARGLTLAITGPLAVLGAIGGGFLLYKNRLNEAADAAEDAAQRMTESLIGVERSVAASMLRTKNIATANLLSSLEGERVRLAAAQKAYEAAGARASTQIGAAAGRGITAFTDPVVSRLREDYEASRERVRNLEILRDQRVAEIKVLADTVNAVESSPPDFGSGAGGDAEKESDKFKELRKQVDALAEGVRLRLDDSRLIGEALVLERALAERAAQTNQTLQDRVTLLTLSNTLAEAARGRLETREPTNLTLAGPTPRNALAAGLENINRQGAPVRAKLAAIAKEAERIQKAMKRLDDLTRLADSLSRALSQFGGFGRGLAEIVSRIGDVTDAMKQLRESQQATGQGGIFANLGNLSAALGAAGAAFGLLKATVGGFFQESPSAKEARLRQVENTEAMERLSSKLDALAGTAAELTRAQIGAGRLAASAAAISSIGFTQGREGQLEYITKLLNGLGISFADLNRLAQDLGIDLIRDNGKIAADALDDLALALGYHADIITRLGNDLDSFRSVQDAAAKLYNLEDTPQRALSEALAELRAFAPELMTGVLAGIDTSGSAGREALQKALQGLFERIRTGGLGIADLGTFEDARALLESILRADSALDQFSESANKATAAMLNVPQGFKVALAAFKASVADVSRPAPSLPTPSAYAPQASNTAAQTASTGALTIPITIVAADDPEKAYAGLYGVVQQKATSYPQMRAFAASLAPPSRN